jgi:hypothetical protein
LIVAGGGGVYRLDADMKETRIAYGEYVTGGGRTGGVYRLALDHDEAPVPVWKGR